MLSREKERGWRRDTSTRHFYIVAEKAVGGKDLNLPSIVVAGNWLICQGPHYQLDGRCGHMTSLCQWIMTGSIFFRAKTRKGDLYLNSLFVAVWEAKCGR